MKCEKGDSESQNDQASDDWFCGENSPVTDRDKKLSFATKVTICINWSRQDVQKLFKNKNPPLWRMKLLVAGQDRLCVVCVTVFIIICCLFAQA